VRRTKATLISGWPLARVFVEKFINADEKSDGAKREVALAIRPW
jgi:hypothetical protein